MRQRVLFILFLVCATSSAGELLAQDANYWSLQYGTRSQQLGGVVVGSLLDLSATFYNPGVLALVKNQQVLLSAKAFEAQTITLESFAGGDDVSSTRFDTSPTLFTGLLPSGWLNGTLAYSTLTRQRFKFRLEGKVIANVDITEDGTAEDYTGELLIEEDMNEIWLGLTWSRALNDKTGIGVTLYGVYRGQRSRAQVSAFAVSPSGMGASSSFVAEFNYATYSALAKIGVAWDYSPLTFGFAMTTPRWTPFGSGDAYFNRALIGLDLDNDGSEDSMLAAAGERGVSATYRSALSIAGGASYKFSNTTLHTTVEWFDEVGRYDVLELTGEAQFIGGFNPRGGIQDELKAVLNAGIGVEQYFNPRFSAFGGFTTDFSAAVPNTISTSTWDIYHITAGSAFQIKGLDLTLGLSYSFGSDAVKVPGTLTDPNEDSLVGNTNGTVDVGYQQWLFIVGFSFSF